MHRGKGGKNGWRVVRMETRMVDDDEWGNKREDTLVMQGDASPARESNPSHVDHVSHRMEVMHGI